MPDVGICALVPRYALQTSIEDLRQQGYRVSGVGTDVAIYLNHEDGTWLIPKEAITDHTELEIVATEHGSSGRAMVVCQPNGESLRPIVDPVRSESSHTALFVRRNGLNTVEAVVSDGVPRLTVKSYNACLADGQVELTETVIYESCDVATIDQSAFRSAAKAAVARAYQVQPNRTLYRR